MGGYEDNVGVPPRHYIKIGFETTHIGVAEA